MWETQSALTTRGFEQEVKTKNPPSNSSRCTQALSAGVRMEIGSWLGPTLKQVLLIWGKAQLPRRHVGEPGR